MDNSGHLPDFVPYFHCNCLLLMLGFSKLCPGTVTPALNDFWGTFRNAGFLGEGAGNQITCINRITSKSIDKVDESFGSGCGGGRGQQ